MAADPQDMNSRVKLKVRAVTVRKIGYCRVSTSDQNLDLQLAALERAECAEIFSDHGISGAGFERPGLRCALSCLRAGDMLVVWRLDRLGRSLVDLITLVNDLAAKKIEFHSLTEAIDTSTSGGRLTFHIMGAMAEFERAIISERTKAVMSVARARGSQIGRKPSLTECDRIAARLAIEVQGRTVSAVAADYNIHPRSLTRILKQDVLSR